MTERSAEPQLGYADLDEGLESGDVIGSVFCGKQGQILVITAMYNGGSEFEALHLNGLNAVPAPIDASTLDDLSAKKTPLNIDSLPIKKGTLRIGLKTLQDTQYVTKLPIKILKPVFWKEVLQTRQVKNEKGKIFFVEKINTDKVQLTQAETLETVYAEFSRFEQEYRPSSSEWPSAISGRKRMQDGTPRNLVTTKESQGWPGAKFSGPVLQFDDTAGEPDYVRRQVATISQQLFKPTGEGDAHE